MIGILVFFMLIFSMFMLFVSMGNIARIKLASQTLDNLQHMYHAGLISKTQAMVFMRDLQDPLDITSILEVNRQLKEIHEKHQNSNR